MRISDWSSDVCSSDLGTLRLRQQRGLALRPGISDISPMASFARSPLTAVLGPTNTGKTYLAVERMCAHSSGMIGFRSEEHTSELQSLMRISYAVFCLKKKQLYTCYNNTSLYTVL